ncbi:MAG: peptide ABC transporter substrate-binding protein [Phycisphaeraceae bacterium]|nr:peptide ABC transporter substrate-binding protein [Phycisphaeraceae bacterium]
MWKLLAPVLLLAGVVLTISLTDVRDPPADFTFINRGDVATLDVQRMSWMQDIRVARLVYEGLIGNDIFTHDYEPRPGVAERWDISDDGLRYRFHLRPDAKWSNGEPVTAHDFVYSWRRALLPDTVSDYAAQFHLIKGGAAFYNWRQAEIDAIEAMPAGPERQAAASTLWKRTEQAFIEMVGLRALPSDDGRDGAILEVELERPTPYFLDLCAFAIFFPVYPPLVKQYEHPNPETGRLEIGSGWTKPGVLISNGPFNLTRWRFKRDMRFEKSPTYWNRDAIAIDTIAMPSVEDPNAQVLAFESGAVDWVSDVSPSYRRYILQRKREFYDEVRAARRAWEDGGRLGTEPPDIDAMIEQGWDPVAIDSALPTDPRKNIHAFPAFGTYFYNFNCQDKLADGRDNPFKDPRLRRAFALAIDKQRIVREVRGVGESVARTLIPPGSLAGYTPPQGLDFDPVAARALLAEAGYPGGRGLPTIEILFNKDGGHDLIAQSIAKDWQDYLGVNVALQMREIKVFRNDLKNQNFMVSRAGWFGDYGDPTTFLDINRANDGNNDRRYNNPDFEGLLDRANDETDPAKRMSLLQEAERILVERDLPLVPIFQYVQMYFFNPDQITGISSHPRQEQNLFLIDRLGDGKGADKVKALPPRNPPQEPGGNS